MENRIHNPLVALTKTPSGVQSNLAAHTQEPIGAAFIFGNYALLETIDANVNDESERYPELDEIVMVKVEDNEASILAVER